MANLDRQVAALNQQLHDNKVKRATLEGSAPDTSGEELALKVKDLENRFARIKKEGEAIARVRDKATSLMDSLDAKTYLGLQDSFTQWLSDMSDGRFSGIEHDNELPEAFMSNGDGALTFSHLSHGTRDMVSLAWKFAATKHFLCERQGFIILDDPLVDMDPQRRALASRAIEKFSKECQVLLFTCHPEHVSGFSAGSVVQSLGVTQLG